MKFEFEVGHHDGVLLNRLRAAGWRIALDLNSSLGGLECTLDGRSIRWTFLEEVDVDDESFLDHIEAIDHATRRDIGEQD